MLNIMEVCGTHTRVIAKEGIKELYSGKINLISGPGCPVCVTSEEDISVMHALCALDNTVFCSFADMLKVPSFKRTPNTKIIYSPKDALLLAEKSKQNIILMAVGFETTAPLFASVTLEARKKKLKNFFVFTSLKQINPAVEALLEGKNNIDGFLLPGNVSIITGFETFNFISQKYKKPGVVAGFERKEITDALDALLAADTPEIKNIYEPVSAKGNLTAQKIMKDVFEDAAASWRGLGVIKNSGFKLKKEFKHFDALKHFKIKPVQSAEKAENKECMCAAVLQGKISPEKCKAFGKKCSPNSPLGPCMVSAEGACNAAFSFR